MSSTYNGVFREMAKYCDPDCGQAAVKNNYSRPSPHKNLSYVFSVLSIHTRVAWYQHTLTKKDDKYVHVTSEMFDLMDADFVLKWLAEIEKRHCSDESIERSNDNYPVIALVKIHLVFKNIGKNELRSKILDEAKRMKKRFTDDKQPVFCLELTGATCTDEGFTKVRQIGSVDEIRLTNCKNLFTCVNFKFVECLRRIEFKRMQPPDLEGLRECRSLEELVLDGNESELLGFAEPRYNVNLKSLSEHPSLKHLDVSYYLRIDLSEFKGCKNLETFNIFGCNGEIALENLPTFSNLKNLKIKDVNVSTWPLRWENNLLEGVCLRRCGSLKNVEVLRNASLIKNLDLSQNKISSLEPLAVCRYLKKVNVSYNNDIVRLDFIAPSSLEELRIFSTAVDDLGPLRECPKLEVLGALRCTQLRDLTPLAGATNLREIDISGSAVEELGPLHECPKLEVLYASECTQLCDLTPLAGAPNLRRIDTSYSAVENLGPLHECPKLEVLYAFECTQLRDLTPLAGAPNLRRIDISGSAVEDLSPLRECPKLEVLYASECTQLRDLTPLAGAPNLRTIDTTYSAVENLGPLRECPKLEVLYAECTQLHDLTLLAGAPNLTTIYICGSAVGDLNPIRECSKLELLGALRCTQLHDLTLLAGAPNLRTIYISNGPIRDLESVRENMRHVTFIESLELN